MSRFITIEIACGEKMCGACEYRGAFKKPATRCRLHNELVIQAGTDYYRCSKCTDADIENPAKRFGTVAK